ncbi:DUF2274 domain-containing protein [Pelagibacterium luteolum]|uniref:DUF2274 domain-containing protein n=1 Tax=Pelagibacterium luteolum TaxID=440168 RepID=A0A1G7Z2D0_9HYPH|nr:DUF2274 domain-containing protein [Pelagibacterium luteolum]SDH02931.1 hypothetical protein SAMN04487974_11725 [Pelagibacterium luteolum]
MTRLKLGRIPDERPVKLTIEVPAPLHRKLIAYGEALAREMGETDPIPPAKVASPMIAGYIDSDKEFAKLWRSRETP